MLHTTLGATCYITVGLVLIIMNIPMLYVIITKRQLRVTFAILGVLYAVGLLTGVSGIIKGSERLNEGGGDHPADGNLTVVECLTKPGVVVDFVLLPSVDMLLCVNSVDRLLVVALPVPYFHHASRFVLAQLAVALSVILSLQAYFVIVMFRNDHYHTTTVCEYNEMLPRGVHTFEISVRFALSTLSIVVMLAVLRILRTKTLQLLRNRSNSCVSLYMRKQKAFTDAMLVSCAITFLLVTIPNVVVALAHFLELPGEDDYVTCTRLVSMLNGINMVVVMMCWRTDLRVELVNLARTLLFPPRAVLKRVYTATTFKRAWSATNN